MGLKRMLRGWLFDDSKDDFHAATTGMNTLNDALMNSMQCPFVVHKINNGFLVVVAAVNNPYSNRPATQQQLPTIMYVESLQDVPGMISSIMTRDKLVGNQYSHSPGMVASVGGALAGAQPTGKLV